MKPRFEEHDNQLFRMLDEPVPLTPDAEMPCLVRLIQDDSSMGRYNRDAAYFDVIGKLFVAQKIKENPFYSNTLHAYEKNSCIASIHTLEIIGYPVEDGSRWWALYQMMQGKKVCHYKSPSIAYYKHSSGIRRHVRRNYVDGYMSIDAWLDGADRNGWQIYEPEPKPLLADAKVGDLVKRRDGHWAQIIETSGGVEFQPIEYLHNKRLIAVTINGSYTVYNDYVQDDIVEYHPLAPEGSAEWALQMWKLGNDIRNETGVVLMADYESEEIRVKHLMDVFHSGWQLYKEPKPEQKPSPSFEVGDWVEYRGSFERHIGRIDTVSPNGSRVHIHVSDTYGLEVDVSTLRKLEPKPEPEQPREPEYVICKRCGGTGYEIKPEPAKEQFEVGDWLEFIDVGGRKLQGKYLSNTDGNAILVLDITCNMKVVVHTTKIIRKLSPFEIIVHIGCLSGTVKRWDSTTFHMFHGNSKFSKIHFDALDKGMRELVEDLLKAQEEEE